MDKNIKIGIAIGIILISAVIAGGLVWLGDKKQENISKGNTAQNNTIDQQKVLQDEEKSNSTTIQNSGETSIDKCDNFGKESWNKLTSDEQAECIKEISVVHENGDSNNNGNNSKTVIAAGVLLDTENISNYPQNTYAWVLLNLLPQWDNWWKANNDILRNRYSGVKITGYHTGVIIKRSLISEYDKLAQYVDPEAKWIDAYYLKNSSEQMISFDDGNDLYYIDIRNADARRYMSKVAQGIMREYNHLVGQSLDGIFLDHVEWKLRQNAQAVIEGDIYRQAMLSFFDEIRAAIRTENNNSELGGNAGAIRDHRDHSLLESLDTVLAENSLTSPFGDSYSDLWSYLEELKSSSSQQTLIIGIYGDSYRQAMLSFFDEIRTTVKGAIRDNDDSYLLESLDTVLTEREFISRFGIDVDNSGCPNEQKWQDAISLTGVYPSNVLVSSDYGPNMHGNLDCYKEVSN